MDFGFFITRHVNSAKTNVYWNRCVCFLNRWYPLRKIVVIDDNSNQALIKGFKEYKNLEIIQSEFPGCGELLPYYYLYHRKFFQYAVIIHDSVFFHRRIPFEKFGKIDAIPLWNFHSDTENVGNARRMVQHLKNKHRLLPFLEKKNSKAHSIRAAPMRANEFPILGMQHQSPEDYIFATWKGCFGVQCFIRTSFLTFLVDKYDLMQMVKEVTCRADRCSLERIFGVLFFLETRTKTVSIFGNILHYHQFNYSFDQYKEDYYVKKKIPHAVTKIFTGR
jgi:hypothetical protein